MAFVLKQISARTGGGTIVRTRRLEAELIRVGRAAASDIVLEDLAVRLDHATIERLPGGRVRVSPLDRAAVSVAGKLIEAPRELTVGGSPVVTLGGQKLTLSAAEDASGDVAVTVEQLGELAPTRDERAVFALGSALASRRTMAWLSIAAVLAVFLAWPLLAMGDRRTAEQVTAATPAQVFRPAALQDGTTVRPRDAAFHPDETWNSGPLSPPHAFLQNDCGSCHAKAFTSVKDENCLACHAGRQPGRSASDVLKDHADPKRLASTHPQVPGFAAQLRKAIGPSVGLAEWSCVGCHREHEGAVTTPASSDQFCSGCHGNMKAELRDTKLANTPSWEKHPQFDATITDMSQWRPQLRQVALTNDQLSSAHPKEDNGLKFPHDMHLSATNGVAQMVRRMGTAQGWKGDGLGCADCHRPDSTGVRFKQIDMETHCASCHRLEFADEGGILRTLRHGAPEQSVAELRDYLRISGPQTVVAPDRAQAGLAYSERAAVRKRDTVRLYPASMPRTVRGIFEPGGACYDCHSIAPPKTPGGFDYQVQPVKFTERYLARGWFDHSDHDTADQPCSRCHAAEKSKSATDLLIQGIAGGPDNIAGCKTCHAGLHPAKNEVASSCASCHSYHNGPGAPAFLKANASTRIARRVPGGVSPGFTPPRRTASLEAAKTAS